MGSGPVRWGKVGERGEGRGVQSEKQEPRRWLNGGCICMGGLWEKGGGWLRGLRGRGSRCWL